MYRSLISIIVPIYNTELFLSKCIDSIIGQTYRNLEIILIDDGSPDHCGKICDEYAAKDSRIQVIHQQNGGVICAREAGIALAAGEYIAFVDSDDWIEADMCERMVEVALADDCDIVWCDVRGVAKDGYKIATINDTDDAEEMLRRVLRSEVPGWLWNKLIKRSFYTSVNVKLFPADSMMEDILLSAELLCANPQMGYVHRPLYNYNRMNDSAMTASHKDDIVLKGINNIRHTYDYLVEKGLFEKYASDFVYLAMQAKMALLKAKGIKEAKALFPYAHRSIKAYRIQYPIKLLYWLGFNGGLFGELLISAYKKTTQWIR